MTSSGSGPPTGPGADLPQEAIPARTAPSRGPIPTERFDIPEIVPATGGQSVGNRGSASGGPPTLQQAVVSLDSRPETSVPPAGSTGPASDASTPGAVVSRVISRRPRIRRVTRVVRHFDPWSVFKVAILFHFAAYVVTLTSGVLLWRVADSTGTLDNVERWFTQFGWETFELDGGEVYHNAWIAGLFLVVAMTGVTVLLATLFNLISDIVGGVRVSVLEEEVVATGPTRTKIRRSDQRSEGGRAG